MVKVFLAIARALLGATVVVLALVFFVLTSAASIRLVAPAPEAVIGANPPAWQATLFGWAWSLALPHNQEDSEARLDNDPLRDWGQRCGAFRLTGDTAQLLEPEFATLSHLGGGLYADRVALANQLDRSTSVLRTTTIATIVLGLCASVLVALSNGEFKNDDSGTGKWVRRLAVTAPALVTAVASYAAFEAPRGEVLRLIQAMPALQKLHRETGAGLRSTACPRTEEEKQKVLAQIAGWTSQWQALRFDPDLLRLSETIGSGLPSASTH